MIKNFQELKVWEKADNLAHDIFRLSNSFPQKYQYDLTSQLRRAALSVPANIAEGSASPHTKELLQFITVARRSTAEVKYFLHFAHRQSLIEENERRRLTDGYDEVHRMLNGLASSLRQRRNGRI